MSSLRVLALLLLCGRPVWAQTCDPIDVCRTEKCGVHNNGCGGQADCGPCDDCPADPKARAELARANPARLSALTLAVRDARSARGVGGAAVVFAAHGGEGPRHAAGADGIASIRVRSGIVRVRVSAVGYVSAYKAFTLSPCRQRESVSLEPDPVTRDHPERTRLRGLVRGKGKPVATSVELTMVRETELGAFVERFRATSDETGRFELMGIPPDWALGAAYYDVHVQRLGQTHAFFLSPQQAGKDVTFDLPE
jgi:hypothetical protein